MDPGETRTPTEFSSDSIFVLLFCFTGQFHKGRQTDRHDQVQENSKALDGRRKEDSTCSSGLYWTVCIVIHLGISFVRSLKTPLSTSSVAVAEGRRSRWIGQRRHSSNRDREIIRNMASERYQGDTGPGAEHENTIPIGLNSKSSGSSRSKRVRRTCRRRRWWWLTTTFLMVFGVFPKGEHFNWKLSYACFYVCWGRGGIKKKKKEKEKTLLRHHQFMPSQGDIIWLQQQIQMFAHLLY